MPYDVISVLVSSSQEPCKISLENVCVLMRLSQGNILMCTHENPREVHMKTLTSLPGMPALKSVRLLMSFFISYHVRNA